MLSVESLLADVRGEPWALRRVVDAYGPGTVARSQVDALPSRPRLIWTGMGSSFAAVDDTATAVAGLGFDSHAELASTGTPRPAGDDTIAVLASASGESAETLDAANRHLGTSLTVAISLPGSTLAEAADHALPLLFGPLETDTALQSFQAALAVLMLLASQICRRSVDHALSEVSAAADALESLIEDRDAWLGEMADLVEGHPIFVAAPAHRMASARQGTLVLREGPRVIAQACEIGDWSHADVYLSARSGYKLVMIGDSPWSAELENWISDREQVLITVGGATAPVRSSLHVPTPATAAPLLETTVLELLAYELLARQSAAGTHPCDRGLVG